jgi:diacylglycerol kinase (ATP)
MVVAGGDGSVHHAAPVAMRIGVPIYHLPCGNENLVAREFGMTRRPQDLSRAIEHGERVVVDVGAIEASPRPTESGAAEPHANGDVPRHFLLMASFGPDASVVHRLAKSRARASGHLAYAGPVAAEFRRPHLPALSVWVDGTKLVDDRRGMLVVANCRRYALGIDPCCRADMTDGRLDVLFMPCEGRWGAIGWGWKCWRRRTRGAIAGRGREVHVKGGGCWQVDGESGAASSQCSTMSVKSAALTVLRLIQ